MTARPERTIREGLAHATARPLAILAESLPKTAGAEPFDPIHDARVALRRLGVMLRAFAPVLAPADVAHMKSEIRWLRRSLGPARDLDVFIHETLPALRALFPDEPGFDALLNAARTRRAPLGAGIARTVASTRCRRLTSALPRFFDGLPVAGAARGRPRKPPADSPLERPLAPYLRALLLRHYRKMRKEALVVRKLDEEHLHRLRIRLRNFRYLCDGFRDVLPARRYAALRTAMQQLQDHMGAFNDAFTAPALTASLARLAMRAHNPALVARAAGFVAGWGAARRQVLRGAIEEPWLQLVKRADRLFAVL